MTKIKVFISATYKTFDHIQEINNDKAQNNIPKYTKIVESAWITYNNTKTAPENRSNSNNTTNIQFTIHVPDLPNSKKNPQLNTSSYSKLIDNLEFTNHIKQSRTNEENLINNKTRKDSYINVKFATVIRRQLTFCEMNNNSVNSIGSRDNNTTDYAVPITLKVIVKRPKSNIAINYYPTLTQKEKIIVCHNFRLVKKKMLDKIQIVEK